MKTTSEVFKEALDELGFSGHKPSEMTNSDYWLCTCTAMEEYAKQRAVEFDKWVRLNYTWDKWLITKTEDAYQLFLKDQQK